MTLKSGFSHSRSLKLVSFESFGTVFYSRSDMALSCNISEIKRDISRKSGFFIPLVFHAYVRESPSEYCHTVWCGNIRMARLPDVKKVEDTLTRFDRIPACDRQTDRPLALA